MTSERVQVDPSEIKVGDLIEVDYVAPYYDIHESITYRTEVTVAETNGIYGPSFNFPHSVEGYTFYRLPKPAPEEPKGLGAVVEDLDGDLWVRVHGVWRLEDTVSNWLALLKNYGPVTVKHNGYTA